MSAESEPASATPRATQRATQRLPPGKRAAVLLLASLGCAFAALLVPALLHWMLRNDAGEGRSTSGSPMPLWYFLTALPIVIGFALIGFVAALYTLWDVDLRKAIPLVSLVTVLVAVAPIPWRIVYFPLAAQVFSLGAGLLMMQWCRSISSWALVERTQPSVFRSGLRDLKGKLGR